MTLGEGPVDGFPEMDHGFVEVTEFAFEQSHGHQIVPVVRVKFQRSLAFRKAQHRLSEIEQRCRLDAEENRVVGVGRKGMLTDLAGSYHIPHIHVVLGQVDLGLHHLRGGTQSLLEVVPRLFVGALGHEQAPQIVHRRR